MGYRWTIASLFLLARAAAGAAEPETFGLTLSPGQFARTAEVVRFPLPPEMRGSEVVLRNSDEELVPLQVGVDGRGVFIVPRQAAGETLQFELATGTAPDQRMVQVSDDTSEEIAEGSGIAAATDRSRAFAVPDRLRISMGGRPLLYYRLPPGSDPQLRPAGSIGGTLQSVLTPRELSVVSPDPATGGMRSFLGSIRRGERLIDFAALTAGETGFEFGDVEVTWNGGVEGGLSAWHRWIDPATNGSDVLLDETWEISAYALPPGLVDFNLFDLHVTQTNVSPDGSDLDWIEPGGLEIAGNPVWRDGRGLSLFAKSGDSDVTSESNSRWAGIGGSDGTNRFSVVVFLPNSDDALPLYSFEIDAAKPAIRVKIQPAEDVLASGASLEWTLRIASFDGTPSTETLEALWQGFVNPAEVAVDAKPVE